MIIRLLGLILLPLLAYWLVQSLARRFQLDRTQTRWLFAFVATLLVAGVLILLGRLPVQFILTPLGVAAAFATRLLPTLLRLGMLLPLWQMLSGRLRAARPQGGGNRSSAIRSRFLAMELRHQDGEMDGEVLEGSQRGRRLSEFGREQLLELLAEVQADGDSRRLLEAYLDRYHEGWRDENAGAGGAGAAGEGGAAAGEGAMTRALALDILGLAEGSSEKEIIAAHRRLMQKLHPDRGGADYLAKRVNEARDFLLGR